MATVPIFDGKNYNFWCVKMRTLFLSLDLWDMVENGYEEEEVVAVGRSTTTSFTHVQRKQRDATALSKIQQGVSDSIFPIIMKATKAKEAWDILQQKYHQDRILSEDQAMVHYMDPILYNAAKEGDTNAIKGYNDLPDDQMRYNGLPEDQLTPQKNTVLHIAVKFGKTEFVREVLEMENFSKLLCQRNSRGETALHLAARKGNNGIVKALIQCAKLRDNQLCARDDNNDSEHLPVESGLGYTKEMLRAVTHEDRDTALHEVVNNDSEHLDVVRLLIEEDPDLTHQANSAVKTPLYSAAERGNKLIVSEILETCEAPAFDGPGGRTALHAAVISNNTGITEIFLNWNKDLVKEPDTKGRTPLHYAAGFGHVQIVKILLNKDKSIAYLAEGKDTKNTALHYAVQFGHVNVVKELISQCPDCWEMVNGKGQNILHVALENKRNDMIMFLFGTSKFMFLSSISKYMFSSGSNLSSLVRQKDVNGQTPLQLILSTNCLRGDLSPEPIQDFIIARLKIEGVALDPQDVICEEGKEIILTNKTQANSEDQVSKSKQQETHLIVATLVATVTFAAGFTMPGGYISNDGLNQGMAVLVREAAFKAFMVTDTIAMTLSIFVVLMHFVEAMKNNKNTPEGYYETAAGLILYATMAMVVAFATGTYAVLAHSSKLAASVCVISFLPFLFYLCFRFTKWSARQLLKFVSRNNFEKSYLFRQICS